MLRACFVLLGFLATVRPAFAAGTIQEIDLRDYVFTFLAPGNQLGPWHTTKLDYSYRAGDDALFVRIVSGNRDDRMRPEHGEFVRLEGYHRIATGTEIKLALGSGSGYQPLRTATAEVVRTLDPHGHIALAAGTVLTSQTNAEFQRIYSIGSDVHAGDVTAYARYYAPVATSPDRSGPGTISINVSCPVGSAASLTAYGNIGGEVGGDRTASQLPTSSGRFGPDIGVASKFAVTRSSGISATYEVAAYRNPSGSFAYMDHVGIIGAYILIGKT